MVAGPSDRYSRSLMPCLLLPKRPGTSSSAQRARKGGEHRTHPFKRTRILEGLDHASKRLKVLRHGPVQRGFVCRQQVDRRAVASGQQIRQAGQLAGVDGFVTDVIVYRHDLLREGLLQGRDQCRQPLA